MVLADKMPIDGEICMRHRIQGGRNMQMQIPVTARARTFASPHGSLPRLAGKCMLMGPSQITGLILETEFAAGG
jgi:hypothetical protein